MTTLHHSSSLDGDVPSYVLPYTIYSETFKGENFAVFHSIANLFPQIMSLSISNISLQACYRESFPANNHFPLLLNTSFPP